MDFQIRECQVGDYEAIYRLNCEEMGYKYPIGKTREKLTSLLSSTKDKIFVAVVKGSVVGYVHANDYDVIYMDHMKNIMGIAVFKDFKKQGIGRALLHKVEEWAKETGACGVRLVSGAARTGAHEFYRCCGYEGGKQQLNFKKYF